MRNIVISQPIIITATTERIRQMSEFEINCLLALGFGFGAIYWAIILWLIFGSK